MASKWSTFGRRIPRVEADQLSEDARADIRAISQHIAMNIPTAIHRFAETGSGRVKALKGSSGDRRLRVGDYRIRFTDEGENTLHIHAVKNRKDAYR